MLTLEPSVSFWDSGEFIAISYRLQVGHPPGAPFYQLLAHLFSLLAGSNTMAVAKCCNALSAVSGGLTVMFLYLTIRLLQRFELRKPKHPVTSPLHSRFVALVGSLCYLFCDTAWFSAVESEVYSLAMLIASVILWAMLRWYHCPDPVHSQRHLLLLALLLGLGTCTHLLTLLTTPVLLLLFIFKYSESKKADLTPVHNSQFAIHKLIPALLLFFLIGLSPYLVIPIRAAAGTPINEGNPSTLSAFKSYLARDQYEHAPLYPRMWRHREHDAEYAAPWCGGDTAFMGNMEYYLTYQLTYMYLRYLMWNFSGRYNDRQGFGSPQNGQFLTGIPPIDRQLVGTSAPLPPSLPTRGHNIYYLLPLLLGLLGAVALARRRHGLATVLTLFLMGGIILNLYLNHPCYEPRERDYAYILSFYAFCIFIAFGAEWIISLCSNYKRKNKKSPTNLLVLISYLLLLAVPLLMAVQNWDDHDRRHRHIAHDAAANILNSCDHDPRGTLLFCHGDNDTFPLWYLQTVEQQRTDIRVENISLMGWHNFLTLLDESLTADLPIYFTHYAYNRIRHLFPDRLQLEGNTYRLTTHPCDSVAALPFYRHAMHAMGWHPVEGVYIDETGCKFLEQYWRDILALASSLTRQNLNTQADSVLTKTLREIPLTALQDPDLVFHIGQAFAQASQPDKSQQVMRHLARILTEQLGYYHTLPPRRQAAMPYTLAPREQLAAQLSLPQSNVL